MLLALLYNDTHSCYNSKQYYKDNSFWIQIFFGSLTCCLSCALCAHAVLLRVSTNIKLPVWVSSCRFQLFRPVQFKDLKTLSGLRAPIAKVRHNETVWLALFIPSLDYCLQFSTVTGLMQCLCIVSRMGRASLIPTFSCTMYMLTFGQLLAALGAELVARYHKIWHSGPLNNSKLHYTAVCY